MYPDPDDRPRVRRVALVAMDRLDRDALCYALNACQRMDARLDVLTNLSLDEANRAIVGARGTADTPWRVIRISGERGDELYRYASDESGLLFLTSSARDKKANKFRDESGPDGMRLGISWAVVASRRSLSRRSHPPATRSTEQ